VVSVKHSDRQISRCTSNLEHTKITETPGKPGVSFLGRLKSVKPIVTIVMHSSTQHNFGSHKDYILGAIRSKRLEEFFKIKDCNIFVETGTYKGHGVQWAIDNNFKKIYSVEIHEGLYLESSEKFKDNSNVKISKADTLNFLNVVVPQLEDNTFFYLDAHVSDSDSGGHWDHPVPFIQESQIIVDKFFDLTKVIIAIDDVRLWGSSMIDGVVDVFKDKDVVLSYVDDTYIFCNKNFIKS